MKSYGCEIFCHCFTSLRECTIPVQTIVVDNASNDGTVEYIRENYPEIILIENKENLGFGQANNLAMRYALDHGCDYVFFLNQDAWVEPDTFEKMVAIHQRNQEYGILGCINVTKGKDHMLGGFIPMIANPYTGSMKLIDDMYYSRVKEVYEIKSIIAAAWLLPRVVLERIGGFHPLFFHFGEDDNYMQRVIYHGFKIGVCPLCPIVHDSTEKTKLEDAVRYRKKEYSQKREWLLDWCDVNNSENRNQIGNRLFWKWLKQIAQLHFNKAAFYMEKYKYYRQNKSAIEDSWERCRTIGPHFLYS